MIGNCIEQVRLEMQNNNNKGVIDSPTFYIVF